MIRKFAILAVVLGCWPGVAQAANCTAYPLPYTLANGQTADASQVMANLNNIINCVNALNAATGPVSSVAGHIATFADSTGKVLQDGGAFVVGTKNLASATAAYGMNMLNGTLVVSNAANALTFTVQTLAGATPSANDPVLFLFRNAAAGTGNYSVISATSALSVTVPTSSTLGFSNNVPGRIWLTAINNAGTVELAVINSVTSTATSKSIFPLAGWGIVNTVALGGPSNSSATFYSTIARSAVPYSVLGYATYEAGLTTAGTWNANPTRMELFRRDVPLPGAVVQTTYAASSTVTTNASGTTLTPTLPAASITPTSAANLVRADARGVFRCPGCATGKWQVYRAAGGVAACTTAVGGAGILAAPSTVPAAVAALDTPLSSSQQTYSVCINLNTAGTTNWCETQNAVVPTCTIELTEIMG